MSAAELPKLRHLEGFGNWTADTPYGTAQVYARRDHDHPRGRPLWWVVEVPGLPPVRRSRQTGARTYLLDLQYR
jgi:hypothetical protein